MGFSSKQNIESERGHPCPQACFARQNRYQEATMNYSFKKNCIAIKPLFCYD